MNESDKHKFAEVFTAACFSFSKDVSKEALRIYWSALSEYPIERVDAAFQRHLRIGKFFPTIRDLISIVEASNPAASRPGADEAWAMIPKDEESSAVLTEEMLGAYSVAAPLLHEGDKIAARMAFKDRYSRLCESAVANGKPIKWVISRGWDRASLGSTIEEAVRVGRISAQEAAPHLAEIEYHSPLLAGLLEGTKSTPNEAKAKEFIAKLKSALKEKPVDFDMDRFRREVEAKDRGMN